MRLCRENMPVKETEDQSKITGSKTKVQETGSRSWHCGAVNKAPPVVSVSQVGTGSGPDCSASDSIP